MSRHTHDWVTYTWNPGFPNKYGQRMYHPTMTACSVCGKEKISWVAVGCILVWLAVMIGLFVMILTS